MANSADRASHTPRALFIAALVSTVLAPVVYGFIDGLDNGGGPVAGVGLLMIGLTFGAPFLAVVFIAAWTVGSLLNRWRIRHVAAFALCGGVLGLSAPILLGLGVETRVGLGNMAWDIRFSAFAGGALSGALMGVVFWLVAEIISRGASRTAAR